MEKIMILSDKLLKEIEETSRKCSNLMEKLPSEVKSILRSNNQSSKVAAKPGASQVKIKK